MVSLQDLMEIFDAAAEAAYKKTFDPMAAGLAGQTAVAIWLRQNKISKQATLRLLSKAKSGYRNHYLREGLGDHLDRA